MSISPVSEHHPEARESSLPPGLARAWGAEILKFFYTIGQATFRPQPFLAAWEAEPGRFSTARQRLAAEGLMAPMRAK